MLTAAATAIVAGPLELLALGLAGVATVVAVGSAIAAYGSRRALHDLNHPADEDARR